MAKRKFNIYVSTKLDNGDPRPGTTICRLARIVPISYAGDTLMNTLNIRTCHSLIAKYSMEGYPSAKAVLSSKAQYNKEFGEKLARKRVYRKVYADIRDDLYKRRKYLMASIDTINIMLKYSIDKCNHLSTQIKRMNKLAAEMEGDDGGMNNG